ncbi:glutamate synthase large subunit [Bacillus taeanensis]|uniref:Glutamate synthase large subunit n=1 Tax=Bacillus taeanensis TaxID=273032 RepID=A0A366XV98_9BACI|nr:glutamate synthase large subunit [Bacillus taeanensis]RBW69498.1 glutamate synthase large subunit [Bacillus taeanensis]
MKQTEFQKTGLPNKQGLYDPNFEHDACGIGLIANLKGKPAHDIVTQGVNMLTKLEHRGGQGSDPATGDGAGIMLQIPHDFFVKECEKVNINLPERDKYGVGMVFFPMDGEKRMAYEKKFETIIEEEGQQFLGWRTVPVNNVTLGKGAKASQPFVRQVFIGAAEELNDQLAFERKLYVIRKRVEKAVVELNKHEADFYVASLSSRTIVYKGMLTPEQLDTFYMDLQDEGFESAFSLVHSRFSTNTFPSWKRAHPNRYLIHNGEINTLTGNVNWMYAREQVAKSDVFGEDMEKIFPIIDTDGSDSSMLDNALEFLSLAGRSLPHAAMMMIPEPWDKDENMTDPKKAFYEYHSNLMEPWDGPTAISFTDGRQIGAILDRNGLRPARYYVTTDDTIIFSSEVGVIDVEPERVVRKERLSPGKMLLIDLEEGRIIADEELKHTITSEQPYREWLDNNLLHVNELPKANAEIEYSSDELLTRHKAFGYTYEELSKNIAPMVSEGKDPIGAMGADTPLAVLSDRPQLLYNYFKQLFAQVTNPPIDAIREESVTSTMTTIGAEGNLLDPTPESCRRIRLETPIITDAALASLRALKEAEFKSTTLPILFNAVKGEEGLETALNELFAAADAAIEKGNTLLVLSDRAMNDVNAPIPALLAVSGLHHHLVNAGTRTKVSLIVESGEPRDVHHLAMLVGYGADLINPYVAMASIKEMIKEDILKDISYEAALEKYIKAATSGIVKVMGKMGISTVQSYRGAQIFEAIGVSSEVINRYFTRTASQIDGIDLAIIAKEALLRHEQAFNNHEYNDKVLDAGSELQWRHDGEYHAFNPKTIHTLQHSTRTGNYELFKEYTKMADEEQVAFLRGAFDFKTDNSIPLDEVESIESIMCRFKTGAMSYGALSKEAHEALAIAMNRIGGKSNSGEGGEDYDRFTPDENGDLRRSAIKQVASGRFGVTSNYLVNADEIQIKMAQGAKPGEGGQLPSKKVYPWVAEVRGSTPGVGLISPPPHHDIYSIEDLAQLIHDLKNANPKARINVKLVAKAGVGTIAAGVAKGLADVILISGYEGGTGASPRTSIKHAGLPWELGLAEAHQTLILNDLRDRVVLETDGKMMTGRDVVVAALLGAEEYGFATAPLVILGCIMMRVCHMDTCPVGVATQDPELRKKFTGTADHVVNYMKFIAQEVRELMAQLGFRTIDEMIGRTDVLTVKERVKSHWKAKSLDLTTLLYQPKVNEGFERYNVRAQNHGLEKSLDMREILPAVKSALETGQPVEADFTITNIDRVAGTILGSEITTKYGEHGLPEDTIRLNFKGSAGQSFGAFVPKGVTMTLEGDSNDYIGKGLSGGKIIVRPSEKSTFKAEDNIIIGNVAFFGATSGEAYVRGIAGERFCVRNSGVHAVVEGVGDHGCEYMTGGRAVILGEVGKNFASGMSGGIAYVLADDFEEFKQRCNQELVSLDALDNFEEINRVKEMIQKHVNYTGSTRGQEVLDNWSDMVPKFVKVIPNEFKVMLESIEQFKKSGLQEKDAIMAAFEENKKKSAQKTEKKDVLQPVQN